MPTSSWRCWPWESDADGRAEHVRSRPTVAASSRARSRTRRRSRRADRRRWPPRDAEHGEVEVVLDASGRGTDGTSGRCGPARAACAPGGGSALTSCPRNSIVPEVGGQSPEMTLNSVVLPAPFGPRIARRSPCATSRSTSRTAWRPPKRRPTPAGGGSARRARLVTSVTCSLPADDLRPACALPSHGRLLFTQPGKVRPGAGVELRERAAERLVDVRDLADRLDRQLAVLQVQLLVVDVNTAWRFLSSLIVPYGAGSFTFAIAAWSLLLAAEMSPLTAFRPLIRPQVLT